ncbi:uncharacterized protein VTP21DRAFT_771 [Calcarisporiella thermophila]|uniref:uncharacterized protein n=1 Tax=Calcarisporiella thermophila TaxID=911321 RepID=UPI003742B98E
MNALTRSPYRIHSISRNFNTYNTFSFVRPTFSLRQQLQPFPQTKLCTSIRNYHVISHRFLNAENSLPGRVGALLASAGIMTGIGLGWRFNVLAEASPSNFDFVMEPESKTAFPTYLKLHDGSHVQLLGLGVRCITFLQFKVYVIGMYMNAKDLINLRERSEKWKKFSKELFLTDESFAESLIEQPVKVTLRIASIRSTNGAHLRDGFTRSLLQRMHEQDKDLTEEDEADIVNAIRDFKALFPKTTIRPGEALVFVKEVDGSLTIEHDSKILGRVQNAWLAKNFIMAYLNPEKPISEPARRSIAEGLEDIMVEKTPLNNM